MRGVGMKARKEAFISGDSKKIIKKELENLKDPVSILLFTSEEENKPFNEFSIRLFTELSLISDKILPKFEKIGSGLSKKHNVTRSPTIVIQPDKYNIRLTGAPAGEELRALLLTLLMVSTGFTILSDASKKRLSDLKDKRNIKVFISPTCPYCPQQVVTAIAAAIEKAGLITTEIIDIYENKDLATKYNAFSVPQVFIDDHLVGLGLQPEEVFIEEVMTAAPVKTRPVETTGEKKEIDLLIIGAGPAGLTAAIYAERSGLKSVVAEKANIGGQVAITPIVENYPGFTRIGGQTLMDMMAQQAIQYADIHEGEEVMEIQKTDGTFQIKTNRAQYNAKAVLLTTGADSRKLGIPGEKEFQGKGVSYCAACDGYFFKDGKKVIVVGGGNTAATEALYLRNIGVDVTLVHRRDTLRAEMFLQQSLANNNVPIVWNTEIREILGDKLVTGVSLENTLDKTRKTMDLDGVFIAIGYTPNNDLAKTLGIETDEEGYIKVGQGQRTTVKGIYAAGDITGGIKQIVTAVSQGAVAATAIFEDISNPYWKKKEG
ncbi:MAG: FAD-dependent pyridine nucleotide-disulfide oxidoreductase [Nitrospirae bacterium]|nr:FAD-dependent pyridine nucleotide-disulfide oxidoreductase [Nitrospirota bacterium]